MKRAILFLIAFIFLTSTCYGLDVVVSDRAGNPVSVTSNRLLVDNSGVNQPVDLNAGSSIGSGVTSVTTAGTNVLLGATTTILSVTVKAHSTNGGFIYVGNQSVHANTGFRLSTGEVVSLDTNNLNDVYIDAQYAGSGVSYIYLIK